MTRMCMLIAALLVAGSLQAQDVELREDHPREYVVRKGDTLWDIAGRFLSRPWQWPAIWQANPDIENPHLIYPGDVISLVYIDGEPRLVADRTKKLSPRVRREDLEGPVTTIPLDAIEEFLHRPRVVDGETLASLPYVIANEERHVYAGPGDKVYARGMSNREAGDIVMIARPTYAYHDLGAEAGTGSNEIKRTRLGKSGAVRFEDRWPTLLWRVASRWDWEAYPVLGYELWEAARARVLRPGDPGILEVLGGRMEVKEGDYVLPVDSHSYNAHFQPRAMEEIPDNARVVALSSAYHGAGHYQIVALNIGDADGVEPGHVFSAFRPGERIRDDIKYPLMSKAAWKNPEETHVELPEEYAGRLMVFRTFEEISYGLVLDGKRSVQSNDILRHPDKRY